MKNVVSGLKLTKKYGQPKVQWSGKINIEKRSSKYKYKEKLSSLIIHWAIFWDRSVTRGKTAHIFTLVY